MRWIISANIKIHGVGVGSLDDYGLTLFENGPTSNGPPGQINHIPGQNNHDPSKSRQIVPEVFKMFPDTG